MLTRVFLPILILSSIVFALPISAQSDVCDVPGAGNTEFCQANPGPGAPTNNTVLDTLSTVIDILLVVVGATAVITIIISGIQYVTSSGDPGRTNKARSALIYSVVAIVIAVLARSIITFVLNRL